MDTGTKTYQIDKHKQLIPLNGNTVNFSCFFEVKSKDKKPFNITIVEQGEIKPKQYKLVDDGYINGQIESDGQLKSYFLVLKAQQPCECNVRVVLKPKEAESSPPQPQQQSPPLAQQPPQQPLAQDPNLMVVQTTPESYFQMKYIIGISAVLILLYLVYKYRRTIFGKFMTKETLARSISSTSFY
ncbi:hypothetical protein IIV22_021L [Invertebrate iridescent virus 22]|uniref:Uncharacterized protein n=1 Tax=Invertebrate iridescent virus 22 TaxID=345198 RepID=S6DA42_9VIRU|nr:hypothetical protein IIV22_021L [Invertebrate iridescent virus 22]CCV01698.1 hypothetical protein IIV22_021L [Invertebrate iridescent virus 22]